MSGAHFISVPSKPVGRSQGHMPGASAKQKSIQKAIKIYTHRRLMWTGKRISTSYADQYNLCQPRRRSMNRSALVLILLVIVFTVPLYSGDVSAFSWEDYKPNSMAKAIADHPYDPSADEWFEGGNFKYIVRVVFMGKFRAISPDTERFLVDWGKAFNHSDVVKIFKQEVLVQEQGKEYWLPIQESLVQPLIKEATSGQTINLYIFLAGKYKRTHIYLVNEFQVDAASH
jgi:hypothetical protein